MSKQVRFLDSLSLEQGINDCIIELNTIKSNDSCTTSVGHLLGSSLELYQVQVIVTRNKNEFLNNLEIVTFNK